MYCIKVYYKDGTQKMFHFEDEEQRDKSKEWHIKSLNVERVTTFELVDCSCNLIDC